MDPFKVISRRRQHSRKRTQVHGPDTGIQGGIDHQRASAKVLEVKGLLCLLEVIAAGLSTRLSNSPNPQGTGHQKE